MLDGGSPRSDRDTGCHDPSRGWRMGVAVMAVGGPGWMAAASGSGCGTRCQDPSQGWWMGVAADDCRRAGGWRFIVVWCVMLGVVYLWCGVTLGVVGGSVVTWYVYHIYAMYVYVYLHVSICAIRRVLVFVYVLV